MTDCCETTTQDAPTRRSRGGAMNQQAVTDLIQFMPPPRPRCYGTDRTWVEWLIQAHVSGLRVVRRVDVGKYTGHRQTSHEVLPTAQIAYCAGCTSGYQRSMQVQSRCQPSPIQTKDSDE